MTAPVLDARDIVKRHGRRRILDGVTLALAPGTLTLLSGPNGAGKTTLLRVLATLDRPESGTLRIAGVDAREDGAAARRALGYAGHDAGAYPTLTVREHLAWHAGFHEGARARIPDVVRALALDPILDARAARLSRGQRQRLALARALVHAPRVLLLDEPWTSLDAPGRAALDAALRAAASGGAAVLAATPEAAAHAAALDARVLHLEDGAVREVERA